MEFLTFQEFADLAGVSSKTIQRHVAKGKLETHDTPFGRRLSRTDLDRYLSLHATRPDTVSGTVAATAGPVQTVRDMSSDSVRHVPEAVPLAAHLAALELATNLQRQVERTETQLADERRRAEQAERSKLALEWQLQKYQTALSEQAESLAEAVALRRAAEARLEEPRLAEPVQDCPDLSLELLRTAKPEHEGWGRRFRRWLGLSTRAK